MEKFQVMADMIIQILLIKFAGLTLGDFIIYIWLPIFAILLLITIILLIRYYNKKNQLKNKLLMDKKIRDEIENKLIEDIEKIFKEFEKYIHEKKYKDAIIITYNFIKDKISSLYNVKAEDYLTEKEMQEFYIKMIPSSYVSSLLNRMYLIYEKVRFGEREPNDEEIREYLGLLKELSHRLRNAIP